MAFGAADDGDTGGHDAVNHRVGRRRPVPSRSVSPMRRCSRTACNRSAVATLTYVYADSTAVLGPLATYAEPHCYDLCEVHGDRLTAPRGWEIVRLAPDPAMFGPSSDDLEALADAVREAGRPTLGAEPWPGEAAEGRPDAAAVSATSAGGAAPSTSGRRGHLWVLPPLEETEPES